MWLLAPPAPRRLDTSGWDDLAARTIPGAYHIHTTRSDGHGDRTAVAAAASRAGLRFIILTDHGDATRPPDPPAYVDGVLVLDGVEISTDDGHYVAIDMPRAPYPLGGAADAVAEDVRRLGGFGIAAHPDSPKPPLRWNSSTAVDAIEWINLDSEWRDETRRQLALSGLGYLLRPAPALARLLDRPQTLGRWDRLAAGRQVVGLAGADAHGGVGRRAEDAGRNLAGSIGIPSYEASFRTFSNRVGLDRPLSGDAATDAAAVYRALRKGRVFTSVDALAGPALLDFGVDTASGRGGMGELLPDGSGATIAARAVMPAGSTLTLVHDGRPIATSTGDLRQVVSSASGAYRIEIAIPGAPGTPPIPWVVSNPVYFGHAAAASSSGVQDSGAGLARAPGTPFPWRIEKDPSSSGTLRAGEHEVSLEYKLGDGVRHSQFVALATDLRRQPFTAVDLEVASDRPMRVSVQLRRDDGGRWGRSYYVDPTGSTLHVPVSDLRPIGGLTGGVAGREATSLLLVVDLTNAAPGRSGTLIVRRSELVK